MNLIKRLFKSSVGRKYLMAISGGGLVLFVTGHMIGNLQIFLGRETINTYAQFLQSSQEVLWLVRLSLLGLLILHVWSAAPRSPATIARPDPWATAATPRRPPPVTLPAPC